MNSNQQKPQSQHDQDQSRQGQQNQEGGGHKPGRDEQPDNKRQSQKPGSKSK